MIDEELDPDDERNVDDSIYDDEAPPPEDLDAGEPQIADEPLFAALLRAGIRHVHGDDPVLRDFVDCVVPRISALLGHKTAKGGNFVVQQRLEGVDEEKLKRYRDDQSMRAHLINGLLPTLHVSRLLKAWGVGRFRRELTDETLRLFCAGYTLHDWLKLPHVDAELAQLGLNHASVNVARDLPAIEAIFNRWCEDLGLHLFLQPLGTPADYLHDLILIASNTQIQWGTMNNLAQLPNLNLHYQHHTRLATDLSTLADYLTYVGRTPIEAVRSPAILRHLQVLSDNQAQLVFHHVAEVRGVMTNMINNVIHDLYHVPNEREAILFAPTGSVYLERVGTSASTPAVAQIAEQTIAHIQAACRSLLASQLQGFKRDGKGLKYAPFYDNFFTPQQLAPVIARGAQKKTHGKKSAAPTRYEKMVATGMLQPAQRAELPATPEYTLDMLAEGLALLEKELRDHAPGSDPQAWILEQLELSELAAEVSAIPQRANTGGVPYQWYYAAGVAHQRHSHRSPEEWSSVLEQITTAAQPLLDDQLSSSKFDTFKEYICTNVHVGTAASTQDLRQQSLKELAAYSGASKPKRSTLVCALCSSSYPIEQQREAAILFAPMVYSNKQPLHSSKATRHICTICELEMMLRVLLMNRTEATGGNFEGRRARYLFFYPTYYWTPETLHAFHLLETNLHNVSITKLRKLLIQSDVGQPTLNYTPDTLQRLQDFLLAAVDFEQDLAYDRWLRYSSAYAGPFGFIGVPPASSDAKEAEAWVQPTLLTLLIPLLIDVKVVASESMLPLLNEATDLSETVMFDGPHQFVSRLVQNPTTTDHATGDRHRLNLDEVLPALRRVLSAYFIHLDANSILSGKNTKFRWNVIPALARDLSESSLHVFTALKRWQRRSSKVDSIPASMAQLYLQFERLFADTNTDLDLVFPTKGRFHMSHARTLVDLYRQFYRAERLKTNAILRPISIAAEVILDAHQGLFDPQAENGAALIEAVRGRLQTFIRNVSRNTADGRLPKGSNAESREAAISTFSTYFVRDIFLQILNGDPAALRGKQLNLLKNACEVIYLDAWKQERADQRVEADDDANDGDEA